MAKKRNQDNDAVNRRQTRKDVLKARKLNEQTRQIRIGVIVVAVLIVAILAFAAINELFIQPGRAVAEVEGESISLREWQNRVRYERAQLIILLENQLEAFGGDVGIIQQFSGQAILQLLDEETFGQTVLDAMIDEVKVRHAADERGITVSQADIDAEIGQIYNFFDGELPTPRPTATETIMPTPSLTPIPTQVITEVLPTQEPLPTATLGPTSTPGPTATPVTQESFDEQYGDFLSRLDEFGIDDATFRSTIENSIYRERLADAIAEEEALATSAPHASYFNLAFGTEEEANEALAMIEADGFLTVWNTIRSLPVDPESESTADASEIVWRTEEAIESIAGGLIAETVFNAPIDTPTEVLSEEVDGVTSYYILMVSGREERPLTESQIAQNKQERLASFLANRLDIQRFTSVYLGRAPRQPILDPLFLAQPTATPVVAIPDLDDGN